jgi:hypothetical protein
MEKWCKVPLFQIVIFVLFPGVLTLVLASAIWEGDKEVYKLDPIRVAARIPC